MKSKFVCGSKVRAIAVAAVLMAAVTPASANLIVNGDFETPALWSAWFFDAVAAGGGSGPAQLNYGIRSASGAGHGGPGNGSYVGGLEWSPGTVSLSQTVSGLTVGAQYALAFELNLRDPQVPVNDSFRVAVDGVTIFLGGAPSTYAGSYVPITVLFTATNAVSTISTFMGQFNSDTSYNIDNVSLNLAANPVPEPVTLALLGLGLAGMGWRHRRRALRPQ